MGLFDAFRSDTQHINKAAKLTKTITLDNGEVRRKGEKVSILYKNGKGLYHAEWNDWACKIKEEEFIFI